MPVAAKHLKLWCGHYSVCGREQGQQTAPQSCNWPSTSLHRYLRFLHRRVQAPDFSTTCAGRVGTFTNRAQENTNLQWRHKTCVITATMLRFGIVSSSAQSPMPIADNLPRIHRDQLGRFLLHALTEERSRLCKACDRGWHGREAGLD